MQQHVRYLDELCPGKVQHVLYMVEYMSGKSTVQKQVRYLDEHCEQVSGKSKTVRYLDEQESGKGKTCSLPGRAGVREE